MASIETQRTAAKIARDLRALGNPKKAEGIQNYFKHSVVALGIDSPTLQSYGRDQLKTLKPRWTIATAISLCDELLQEPELEIRGIGILILAGFRPDFTPGVLSPAKRWLTTGLDNWALVDTSCGQVLTPLLASYPEVLETLRQWSRAEKSLWMRRAALVTLVLPARRGQYLEAAYELASEHFSDGEDLMHKAIGWLLREAGKTDMPRLKTFLLQHGNSIPRTSLRYAIERFPEGVRRELLLRTRGSRQAS